MAFVISLYSSPLCQRESNARQFLPYFKKTAYNWMLSHLFSQISHCIFTIFQFLIWPRFFLRFVLSFCITLDFSANFSNILVTESVALSIPSLLFAKISIFEINYFMYYISVFQNLKKKLWDKLPLVHMFDSLTSCFNWQQVYEILWNINVLSICSTI